MNKEEALKRLNEIFNPALERCKQKAILNQHKKIQKNKTNKYNESKNLNKAQIKLDGDN